MLESAELPEAHSLFFISSDALHRDSNGTAYEGEPALLFGLSRRVAAELHAHVSRNVNESLRFEGISPAIHVQFPQRDPRWQFGVAAEYELNRGEEPDALEVRLITIRRFEERALGFNLIGSRTRDGHTAAGYALAYRPNLEARIGWGVEAEGEISHGGSHQAIVGLYTEPLPRLSVKIGAGAVHTEMRTGALVRTSIVVRF